MNRLKIAALLGASGVIAGAFGAHALKSLLTEAQLSSWHTAVNYQLFHSLFLLVLGYIYSVERDRVVKLSFAMALAGVVLFSFSIYLLVLQSQLGVNLSWLGPITPIGGVLLIASWLNLLRLQRG